MRNSDLLTCFIELSVFDIDHEQAEQLILSFIDLHIENITPSFSFKNTFSILPINC
jgi:hypothetical protein